MGSKSLKKHYSKRQIYRNRGRLLVEKLRARRRNAQRNLEVSETANSSEISDQRQSEQCRNDQGTFEVSETSTPAANSSETGSQSEQQRSGQSSLEVSEPSTSSIKISSVFSCQKKRRKNVQNSLKVLKAPASIKNAAETGGQRKRRKKSQGTLQVSKPTSSTASSQIIGQWYIHTERRFDGQQTLEVSDISTPTADLSEISGQRSNIEKSKMSCDENTMDASCVICQSASEKPYIDIYQTQTNCSQCLLSEFISKTTKIIFDRDKLWSKTLCRRCYDLIIELDQAETQYIKLKNDFIDVLSKNELITKLKESEGLSNVDNSLESRNIDKVEYYDIPIKCERNDDVYSPQNATPIMSDDSDDEPLLGRGAKKKKSDSDLIPNSLMKVEPTIKCEFEEPVDENAKLEVFACRSCKEEFDTKDNAAVHAFTVHQVDVATDPSIIKVKSSSGKEGKKRRGRKKGKRKSLVDVGASDVDDPDKDKDWSIEKETSKQMSRSTRSTRKNHGKMLSESMKIDGEENMDEVLRKTSRKSLQKHSTKKNSSNIPGVSNSTTALSDGSSEGVVIKSEDKDKALDIVEGDVLKVLQVASVKTKMEKRPYIRKQKPLLTCPQCPATFTSQNRMDLHMVKHTGTLSPYICEICGASYKHKKACDIHVEMHKGISPWKCTLCDKIFPSKGALCRHEAIHTGTPNYQCDLCGKSFIHTSSFKMHKLSHSGLKPHSCNKCGLALMTRSHLKRHQRVHSGEKRHECPTCGKKFSERYNLYAHQKSHEASGTHIQRQVKTHDCTVCEAIFNRRYVLEKHMETAHQRVLEPMPKKTRNTMTKLLKQQALMQQQHLSQSTSQSNTSDSHDVDVKLLITKTPPLHNTDNASAGFIGETSFQPNTSQNSITQSGLIVVTKEELPEAPMPEVPATRSNNNASSSSAVPVTTSAASSTAVGISSSAPPAVVWPGLYQLANDYPLRMHGVDYLGRTGH